MRRIALLKDGKIVNIVLWDGIKPWYPGDEYAQLDVTDDPSARIYVPEREIEIDEEVPE